MCVFLPWPSCSSKDNNLIYCHENEKSMDRVSLDCRQKLPFSWSTNCFRHYPLRYPHLRHRRTGCRYSYSSFPEHSLVDLAILHTITSSWPGALSHRDFKFTNTVLLQPAHRQSITRAGGWCPPQLFWLIKARPQTGYIKVYMTYIFLMRNDPGFLWWQPAQALRRR